MQRLTFRAVTPGEWKDLETLFGPRGACGGCWCMWWRLTRSQFNAGKDEGNRESLKKLIAGGSVPGILAYEGERPVGWCSVAPREEFPGLQRSRVLAPVDTRPAWSIVCFFVAKDRRRSGITDKLIHEAVRYAGRNGARIVEGYPVEPGDGGTADAFAFTGIASAFARAGFVEAARRSPRRAIYRKEIGRESGRAAPARTPP